MRSHVLVLCSLVLVGFAARLLPHAWNFTPVIATVVLAGVYARPRWLALAACFTGLWLSDFVLNNYVWSQPGQGLSLFGNWGVYLAVALVAGLPAVSGANARSSWAELGGLGLGGAAIFYLVTNTQVWLSSGMYSPDAAGLLTSLVAGFPFFLKTLASTLLFGALAVTGIRYLTPAPRVAVVPLEA